MATLEQHLTTLRVATRGRGLFEITADVRADLDRFCARLVPDGDPLFRHTTEGPDDMPSHVRSALTATQLAVPVLAGQLALGTWQGIYVWEHRVRPHTREVVLYVSGERAP